MAFADHGISSQSSTSQPVSSSFHSPADSTASRTRLSAVFGIGVPAEERTSGPRVDRARLATVDAEALTGDVGIAADDNDRA